MDGLRVVPGSPPEPVPYDLPLIDSRAETPTAMSFRFSTEGTDFQYRPNQAVRIILPDVLDDPYGPRRTFSLCSSPTEPGQIAIIAKITDSPYKSRLRRLAPGDRVRVFGPRGDFFYNPSRSALFVAGGIGISPFRGMMRFATDTHVTQPIVALYSARTPEEFAFRGEFDSLVARNPHLTVRYTVTRRHESTTHWTGRTGRIDEALIREGLETLDRPKAYVVGLPAMAQETLLLLRERFGFVEDDLEYEFFRGY
jgi:ferredoxin-NADP reductase